MAEIAGWSSAILFGLSLVAGLMWQRYRFLDGGFLPVTFTLAVSAAMAENSSISWYRFYSYSPDWGIFIGHVPLHVVMIWPLFILGEVRYIREGLGLGSYKRHPHQGLQLQAALQASFCFVDTALLANLIEVYCVSAGLWSWKQENCLGVPWIGALGWALFATPAVIMVSLLEDVPWGWTWAGCLLLLPFLCLMVLHVGILVIWNLGGGLRSAISPWQEAAGILLLQLLYHQATKGLKVSLHLSQELPRILACGIVAGLWLLKGRQGTDHAGVIMVSAASLARMLAFEWR
ncbi:unnamed protein product [Symbiodinium pilosum]|uniref:Uncharacterized protein n=1 Tax=Symbiodinium pilosum TaxID=2952 RepID=A0A812S1Q7_SYMPI|nr:unnamed protein product [Symbiodinium pilosum]